MSAPTTADLMNSGVPLALPPQAGGSSSRTRGGARGRTVKPAPLRLGDWAESLDVVRLPIAGVMIISISAVHMYLGPLQYIRPALSFLALAVASVALKPKLVRWRNLRDSWPAQGVILFLLLCLVSSIFGLSPGGSVRYILDRYSKVLIFYFLMVVSIRSARDLAVMMWAFVISVGIVIILAFTVLDLKPTHDGLGRLEGGATMFDANDIGMIFLMCLPIALLLVLTAGKVGRIVAAAVLAGIPVIVALTGSRGALIGMALSLFALFFVLSRVGLATRLSMSVALLGGLALAAPAGYWKQMSTILNPSKDYNTSDEYGRIGIAKRGVGYMLSYPVTGVGIANFPRAEGTISPIAQARAASGLAVQWIAPHNTYVQVGAELGIPGFVLWMTLLTGGTVGLWRLRKKTPRAWEQQTAERRFLREAALFLPVSFIAFGVTSFFLSHAYTPPTYIIFGFHAAIVMLIRKELRADRRAAELAGVSPRVGGGRLRGGRAVAR